MEYLREEEETETGNCKIGTILVGESSEEMETQDVEVSLPVEAWQEQEKKVSWVDRIKTIGKYLKLHFIFTN